MRYIKFTVENSEEYGFTGIVPNIFQGWNGYIPTTTPGHDLLDHTTKETGETWQEFRALGANLWHTDFSVTNSFEHGLPMLQRKAKSLASAIDSTFRDSESYFVSDAPKCSLNSNEKSTFQNFFNWLDKEVIELWESEYNEDYDAGEECPWLAPLENIKGWLMYGYANAKKRFEGEKYEWLKDTINNKVQKAMPMLEEFADTGIEFTLSYNLSGEVRISEPHYKNEYYY